MNRITKLLSFAVLFSIGIATENDDKTTIENLAGTEEGTSQEVSLNEAVAPVNLEKIKKTRVGKAKAEKIRSTLLLQKHKSPMPMNAENPNFADYASKKQFEQRVKDAKNEPGLFERFGQSMREKYKTMTLRSEYGKKKLKFPENNEAN